MNQRKRYLLLGLAFGFMFPIAATVIEFVMGDVPFSLAAVPKVHLANPLLLIIDTAPFFLGLFSYLIGLTTDRMLAEQEKASKEILLREQKLREYSENLEKSNLELTTLNSTLDGLVYTASHDLKTPVVNFQGLLKMLRTLINRPGSEKMVAEVLDRMEKATYKFQSTISDLLDVTRVEKDLDEAPSRLQLEPTLNEIISSIAEVATEKKAVFDVDVTNAPEVLCTPRNLDSLLQNLLTNALKYSHPDRSPQIDVRSREEGNFVVVSVADNGLGIDLEGSGKKLFRMFSRLHAEAEGSGIGLYIVKKIISKMGGKVEVESAVNVGTTFRLYFPKK